jgi:hypothetical protein
VNVKIRFTYYAYLTLFLLFAVFLVVIFMELVQPMLASNTFSTIPSSDITTVLIIGTIVVVNYISALSVFLKHLNTL